VPLQAARTNGATAASGANTQWSNAGRIAVAK